MSRLPGPVLKTERLFLQTPKMRDVPEVFRWTRDPAITRYMSWSSPTDKSETEKFVRESIRNQQRGTGLGYLLHDAESGRVIGACGAHNIDASVHLTAEVGYWIARPYWRQGLITEALHAFFPHLFLTIGLHRLCALVFEKNDRSAQLLEKLGFQIEGTLRHNIRKNGRAINVWQYAMLSTDPAAQALLKRAGH